MSISVSIRNQTLTIYTDKKSVDFEARNREQALRLQKFLCKTMAENTSSNFVVRRFDTCGITVGNNDVLFADVNQREQFIAFVRNGGIPELEVEANPVFYAEDCYVLYEDSTGGFYRFRMQAKTCATNLVHMMNNRGAAPIFAEAEVTVVINDERAGFASPRDRDLFLRVFPATPIWKRVSFRNVGVHAAYSTVCNKISGDLQFEMANPSHAAWLVGFLNDRKEIITPKNSLLEKDYKVKISGVWVAFFNRYNHRKFLEIFKPGLLGVQPEGATDINLDTVRIGDTVVLKDGREFPVATVYPRRNVLEIEVNNGWLPFSTTTGEYLAPQHELDLFGEISIDNVSIQSVKRGFHPKPGDIWEGTDGHRYVIDDFPNNRIAVYDRETDERLFFGPDGVHRRLDVRLVKKIN